MFVGTTALGTREVVATPLDTLFSGVEVQATVADNLLQRDFIRRPAFGADARECDRAGPGLAIVLLVAQTGIVAGIVGTGAGVAALWWGERGCCRIAACSCRRWRRRSACWDRWRS